MSCIGLDLGLTGCKACLFDEETGALLGAAYREYRTEAPRPGWAELNPHVVWGCATEVLRGLSEAAQRNRPRALAVSSHGESAVPVGANGQPLANAIAPFDQRMENLDAVWGDGPAMKEMVAITGQPPHTMYTLPRILWLRQNRPEVFGKTWKFLCFQEYLLYRLGAREPVTSFSQAARTWAFDISRMAWSDTILGRHGLDASLLARVAPSASVIGEMNPGIAETLGLPKGIALITGGHDQACGALGAGVIRPGLAVDTTGTVECITPAFSKPLPLQVVLQHNFCNAPHVVSGQFVSFAWSMTGGNLLKWYRDRLADAEADAMTRAGGDFYAHATTGLPDGPSGILALPHFSGSGTPHLYTDSRGALLGLDFETDKKRLVKAFLEGLTLEMRYNLCLMESAAGVAVEQFAATGGGAKSEAWLQIKADIFNRPVARLNVTEAACLGCAMLCAHALDGASYEDLAARWLRVQRLYEPQPRMARAYDAVFDLYCRMQKELRPLLQELYTLRRQSFEKERHS